jgi:hypothetical protein
VSQRLLSAACGSVVNAVDTMVSIYPIAVDIRSIDPYSVRFDLLWLALTCSDLL